MKEIKVKSWKWGTTAHTIYFLNNFEIARTNEDKRNCGIDWFSSLPESEEKAKFEELCPADTPAWLDEIIENKKGDTIDN